MKYTYELHPTEKAKNAVYTKDELIQLTTLQLREICQIEKLVIGVAYRLDRNHIIETILKYRGAKLFTFVDTRVDDSLYKVFNDFEKYLKFDESNKKYNIPTKITFYKKVQTGHNDNYKVESNSLYEGNVLLISDKKEICAILNMKRVKDKYYLFANPELFSSQITNSLHKNYSLGFLDEFGSKYLYNYYYNIPGIRPTKLNCYLKLISELTIMETKNANTSLVIDFGTSNSSIGAYLDEHYVSEEVQIDLRKNGIFTNEINKVKFINAKSNINEQTELIPTVVSVKSCGDPQNIEYLFGYEALNSARKHSYNNPQSVFYGIKKWVNNYNKIEEISDQEGNIAAVSRKDIVRAYFKFLILNAQQQHKCIYSKIHITSPVKQKQQYLQMYKDILHDYDIETKTALDEGIAVLYNSVSNQIEGNRFVDGDDYKALIIDCGGGTTDLTSCDYYIEDNQITYKLHMTTTYANGETNFGGNNITFRIFQFLKIVFERYYTYKPPVTIDELFENSITDTYRFVDNFGNASVYEKFEKLYLECEETIPTRFFDYKNYPMEVFMKVKSNFYFLWNLAEKIKIDFYENAKVSQTSFHETGIKSHISSKIFAEESWRINIYEKSIKSIYNFMKKITPSESRSFVSFSNDLKRHHAYKSSSNKEKELILRTDFPNIIISKEEISTLIKADIYNVIKKFIEPIYNSDQLQNFNFIKLTGQTCKIDIFRDALKEFIPGKVIESSKKEKTIQDYKLTCLEGAIKYQSARKIGLIAPTITNNSPVTPYKLIALTHTGLARFINSGRAANEEITQLKPETIMIASLEEISKSYGFVSRNIDTENIELILKDGDDKILHKYSFNTTIEGFRETDYNETSDDYEGKILQGDIDSIVDDEIKIFSFAFEDKWGFYVLPIARKSGKLLMGEKKYFPFENDEWEINFFDGKK